MAQDKFKSVAATFQIFKDGEAVSARKLDGIIKKNQEGVDNIQQALGDMGNYGLAFSGLPLFHNSIARAIGPINETTLSLLRVFRTPQNMESVNRGLIRAPYSTAAAVDIGNRSQNLLPIVEQADKIGVGCVNDDGSRCTSRFTQIYDEEKNILSNGLFDLQLSGWQASGVIFDGNYAHIGNATRYNTLPYSEDFSEWTMVSGTLIDRAADDPNGSTNATSFSVLNGGADLTNLSLDGSALASSSTDWCFSVYMASSGTELTAFLEIDGATHVRSTQGRGAIDPAGTIYSVDISGTAWNRYYVYGTTDTKTSGVARIHLGRGNSTNAADELYIWGAQLEPTTSPSTYQATSGAQTSTLVQDSLIGQTFTTIPKKWYQVSIDFNTIGGDAAYSLYRNGVADITLSDAIAVNHTFQATTTETNIYVTASGADGTTVSLENFRVDPGTPCHALNCPGFSAYERDRRYRATLPTITVDTDQYYGSRLQFPDELNVATVPSLPANVMGVFDHEQNHTVPDRIVAWNLANWPIGIDILPGSLTDPEFLEDWTTSGVHEYPSELIPSGTGVLSRDVILTTAYIDGTPSDIDTNMLLWLDSQYAFSGYVQGDRVVVWEDRSSYNRNLLPYNGSGDAPSVDVRDGGKKICAISPANGDRKIQMASRLEVSNEFTFGLVHNVGAGLQPTFGNPQTVGTGDNDGYTSPNTTSAPARIAYDETVSSDICSTNLSLSHSNGDLMITTVRRDASGEHFITFDGIDHSMGYTNNSAPLNIWALFSLDDDSVSTSGAQIGELVIYDSDKGATGARALNNYLSDRWDLGVEASGVIITSGIDRLIMTAASGQTASVSKAFYIEKDTIATWTYRVFGNIAYSGVQEIYEVVSGAASVDTILTGTYVDISGSDNPYYNSYRVSGSIAPGDSETWAQYSNGGWNITRRIQATSNGTWVNLGIAFNGEDPSADNFIKLDNFDVSRQASDSSYFSYCGEPILGLNWNGRAEHVRNENLFVFSNDLLLWQLSGLTGTIDTDSVDVILLSQASGITDGSIYQVISGSDILDDQLTLTWQSHSATVTSGIVTATQTNGATQSYVWDITPQDTSGIVLLSGLQHEAGGDLEVKWTLYGDSVIFSYPQLVHGSGVVNYISTSAEPIKKYRRVVTPVGIQTVDASWTPGYALVEGGLIQTNHISGIDTTGSSWQAVDTRNFPAQGVIRVGGQEYGYRIKTSGIFGDTLTGWRGTTFNPNAIVSGSRITNVPIPQSITNIDSTTKEITFRDIIPAPLGDWGNSLNLQIYNTHISNLDRFSLQASAVPVTRAAGNLLTSFVQHVSDHRRHVRMSQLCGYILDGSSWAAMPEVIAELEIIDSSIEELTEQAQLNVVAKRFVPASTKEVTVNWGDNQTTVISGAYNNFNGITHTYDLRDIAYPITYTISVVVRDLDLDFERSAVTNIVVYPKINSAGQPTKSTISVGAKMLTQNDIITTAGAKIKDQNSSTTTAGAKITV